MNKLECNCDLTSPTHEKPGFNSKKIFPFFIGKNLLLSNIHHRVQETIKVGRRFNTAAPDIFMCFGVNKLLSGYKNEREEVSVIQKPTIQ